MPGATWIRDLRLLINQREIYSSNQLYSYKVYFDTEFSYPTTVKDGFLSVAGYQRDIKDPDSVNDEGYKNRKNMFNKSKTVQLISKLSTDLFNQDLYLIRLAIFISQIKFYSNVEVDLEITPQSDDFMIIQKKLAANEPKFIFKITDVRLMVKTIDLMDGLSLDVAKRLDVEPAKYGVRKTELVSHFISTGRKEFQTNLFMNEVPRRVIIGLLSTDRYIGSKYESPFKFTHFNVRDIELRANGRIYPQYPYK